LSFLQRLGDRIKHSVDSLRSIRLGELGGGGDGVDEFVLIHELAPLFVQCAMACLEFNLSECFRRNGAAAKSLDRRSRGRQLRYRGNPQVFVHCCARSTKKEAVACATAL